MHLSAILVRSIEKYRGIHKVNSTYSPVKATRYGRELCLKRKYPRVGREKSFEWERYNLRCNVHAYVTAESFSVHSAN